jgi:hypothetical protein
MKIFFTTTVQRSSNTLPGWFSAYTAQLQRMEGTLPGYPGKLFTQVHKKTLRWVEGFSVFNKDVG